MSTFDHLPLRQQKPALTRRALVEALMERLASRTLDDIKVGELAKAAGISQATFFNYFPSKGDLLTHFIRLWSLRVAVIAREAEASHDSALAALEAILLATAEQTAPTPKVMLETIAHQARMPADQALPAVDRAERLLLLGDRDDLDELPDGGLGSLIPPLLAKAVAQGELPAHTDVMGLTLAVASVFFGVPLVLAVHDPQAIGPTYQRQLRLLWAGARALQEAP